jgi:catechol 2,3-dioxygenase-like lactoylglutathione lyase family enzyme
MPKLNGIIETAIYVCELETARRFYEDVLQLKAMFADKRLIAYDVGGRNVLLVFHKGGSAQTATLSGGTIPGHDGAGPSHFAFAVAEDQLSGWEERLERSGIAIEARMDWPRGGKSLYFRDPDGHLVELATPGLWPTY